MKCTMPGCRAAINGFTGLQELMSLRKHFSKKHKVVLDMMAALQFREAIEAGLAPLRVEGTESTHGAK